MRDLLRRGLDRFAQWPERSAARRWERSERDRVAVRATRDVRVVPVAVTAWATALVTVQHSVSPWAVVATGLGAVLVLSMILGLTSALVHRVPRHRVRSILVTALTCTLVASGVGVAAWGQGVDAERSREVVFGGDGVASEQGGQAVRVSLHIRDRPNRWFGSDPFRGRESGEGSTGVVVPVTLDDGAQATVMASDTRWSTVRTGDLVEAVVDEVPSGTSELVLRAHGPPSVDPQEAAAGATRGAASESHLERTKSRFMAAAVARGTDAAGLFPGMTYGDRSGLDPALEQAMRDTGLTHLTAVSGSNCALVMVLAGHMALTIGARRRVCVLAGLVALGVFVLLVGPDASVLRAGVMGAISAIGILVGRGRTSLALLSTAVAGLLLVDPSLGQDFGFALSVCATAGIVITGRPLIRVLDRWLPTVVSTLIAIPVVAQLWCAPVLTLLTSAVPAWSVPANAVVAPLVPVITILGLTALVSFGIGGGVAQALGDALVWAGTWPVEAVAFCARFFASLPGAVIPWWDPPAGPLAMTAVSTLQIAVIHVLDRRTSVRIRAGSVDSARVEAPVDEAVWRAVTSSRHRWRIVSWIVTLVCVVCLIGVVLVRPTPREDWRALMCDVGQGDALLLKGGFEPRATTVLIDAGPDPRSVRTCLRRAGVKKLDLLILTHDHADHVAGAQNLAQEVEIDRVWWSSGTGRPPVELSGWGMPQETPTPGRVVQAPGLRIEVLGPLEQPVAAVDSRGENNASLAVRVDLTDTAGDTDITSETDTGVSLLAAGDLEEEGAQRLISRHGSQPHGPLDVDVLKVSHHGARNGGTDLIDAASPSLALISVGEDNDYGHPTPEILQHLADAEVPVARTDQLGTVGLYPDGEGVTAEPFP